jgi:hypothetical protein
MPFGPFRKVLTERSARQGYLDSPVLMVLTASLLLAVVLLGALWFGAFGGS